MYKWRIKSVYIKAKYFQWIAFSSMSDNCWNLMVSPWKYVQKWRIKVMSFQKCWIKAEDYIFEELLKF